MLKINVLNVATSVYGIVTALILGNIFLNLVYHPHDLLKPQGNKFKVLTSGTEYPISDGVIYGFLPYWTIEEANYIQLSKLTDIAYFALQVEANGHIKKLGQDGNLDPGYNNWVNNETLNTLIAKSKRYGTRFALTIISHEADISDQLLECEKCWVNLKNDLIDEMNKKEVKHLNLDFEYATYTDPYYADQYTKLTKYLNTELDKEFGSSYVVVSTFADSAVKPRVTKPGDLAKVADGLFIMAYDFHRPNSDIAGPVAPLGGVLEEGREYDINTMLTDYLSLVPPSKMILGVPYYGYNWVVEDFAEYSPRLVGNDYIGYSQSQKYEDIIDLKIELGIEDNWDEIAQVPYFSYVSEDTGSIRSVYYENERSLREKYKLAKKYALGGVGIWALGYDGGYQDLWALLSDEFPHILGTKAVAEN
ncbi:MAG: glycosyl hydrolase family 18 protein [Patescibacteria group bacterium]